MSKNIRSLLVIAALIGSFWLGSFAVQDTYSDDSAARTPWEYTILRPSYEVSLEEQMNQLGKDGWELVFVVAPTNSSWEYYFKRPPK
jgi:hypothetical protein